MAPCNLIEVYWRFGVTYRLQPQCTRVPLSSKAQFRFLAWNYLRFDPDDGGCKHVSEPYTWRPNPRNGTVTHCRENVKCDAEAVGCWHGTEWATPLTSVAAGVFLPLLMALPFVWSVTERTKSRWQRQWRLVFCCHCTWRCPLRGALKK